MLRENNKVWCSNCTATEDAPRCKGCFKPIIAGTGASDPVMTAEVCSRVKPWWLLKAGRLRLGAWTSQLEHHKMVQVLTVALACPFYSSGERLLCS